MIDQYGVERPLTEEERRDLRRAFIRTRKTMIIDIAMNDERFSQEEADEWLAKEDEY